MLGEVERDVRVLANGDVDAGVFMLEDSLAELEVKRQAAQAAANHALDAARARDRAAVNELRAQLAGTLDNIELAVAELRPADDNRQPISPLASDRRMRQASTAFKWREYIPAITVGTGGVVAAAVVISALMSSPEGSAAPPVGEAAIGTPGTRSGVAGSSGTPRPSPSSSGAPTVESWSFDEVEMGTAAPAGFTLQGPDDAVSVAAFPTAVDRSLRLRATDTPSGVCHSLSASPTQVAVRLRLEGALLSGSVLVELVGANEHGIVAAVLSDSGALALRGASDIVVVPTPGFGQWYEMTVGLGADGMATVVATAEDGIKLGGAAVRANSPVDGAQEVCFGLPAGNPAAELYISDLEITY